MKITTLCWILHYFFWKLNSVQLKCCIHIFMNTDFGGRSLLISIHVFLWKLHPKVTDVSLGAVGASSGVSMWSDVRLYEPDTEQLFFLSQPLNITTLNSLGGHSSIGSIYAVHFSLHMVFTGFIKNLFLFISIWHFKCY